MAPISTKSMPVHSRTSTSQDGTQPTSTSASFIEPQQALSPRDQLWAFQLRRENKALLNAFNEEKSKNAAFGEQQNTKEKEMMDRIARMEHDSLQNQTMINSGEEVPLAEKLARVEMAVTSLDKTFGKHETQKENRRAPAPQAQEKEANEDRNVPAAPKEPKAVPLHQRRAARLAKKASQRPLPENEPDSPLEYFKPGKFRTTLQGPNPQKEKAAADAPIHRKISISGLKTPVPPIPERSPLRPSYSDVSSLSSIPSSLVNSAGSEAPLGLPFNDKGDPTQGILDLNSYFKAVCAFAVEGDVQSENHEEQTTFIVKIMRGMKKEERSAVVEALVQAGLAKYESGRRSVQFLSDWQEVAECVTDEVLYNAKAKAALGRVRVV